MSAEPFPDPFVVIDGEPSECSAMVAQDLGTDLDASYRFAEANENNARHIPGIGWHV